MDKTTELILATVGCVALGFIASSVAHGLVLFIGERFWRSR